MKDKRINKLVFVMAGIVVAMAAIYIILQQVEKVRINRTQVASGSTVPKADWQKNDDGPKGTVRLAGKKYEYFHEIENYLFMGTDESGSPEAKGEAYRGSMADFLMLVVIDKTEKTYATLQLNRDTMTEVTLMQTDGSKNASAEIQLCTAHWYGGNKEQSCENTVEAVSKLLGGIPIHGYYALDMKAIPQLNHAVGGVEVTIENDFEKVDSSMKKGEKITLSDEQAYTFIHDRYGVDDEKNTSRMQRQRQYMQAFFAKAKKKAKEKPNFINKLFKNLKNDAVTNLSGNDISKLTNRVAKSDDRGIFTLEGESKIGKALDDGIDHAEFYVYDNSLNEVMTELYHLKQK